MRNIDDVRKELSFTNDIVFCTIMEENPDLCKQMVEKIIGRKIGKVKIITQQKTIRNDISGRNVCLDVYFEDDMNTAYNIEMQTTKNNDVCRRARYYQSKIDCGNTKKGSRFETMKDCYIIFICIFDPMGLGLPVYTVRNRILEAAEEEYEDGATKIFINASESCKPELLGETSLDLQSLIRYCSRKEVDSELTRKINSKVVKALEDDEMVVKAMTVGEKMDMMYETGLAEGHQAGLVEGLSRGSSSSKREDVDKMSAKLGISIEEACSILDVTKEEYINWKEA